MGGNAFSSCVGKTGQDAVDCFLANTTDKRYGGVIHDQYFGKSAPSEATSKKRLATVMPPEMVDAYYDFLVDANSGPVDPEIPWFALTPEWLYKADENQVRLSQWPVSFGSQVFGVVGGGDSWTDSVGPVEQYRFQDPPLPFNAVGATFFHTSSLRLQRLCGKFATEVGPYFYNPYNNDIGRKEVDNFLRDNPDLPAACVDALKNNYKDANAQFRLLDPPNLNDQHAYFDKNDEQEGILDWTNSMITNSFHKTPMYPQSGDPNPPAFLKFDFGNPTWSHKDRTAFWTKALGSDPGTGASFAEEWAKNYVDSGYVQAGKGAQSYFNPSDYPGKPGYTDDPSYAGNLPYLPAYEVRGDEPWHHITQDPDAYGYINNCGKSTWIQTIVPILAGMICAAIAGMFVPGTRARLFAVATTAPAVYYVTDYILEVGGDDYTERGATILGTGIPVTLLQAGFDTNIIPVTDELLRDSMLVLAGAAGYYFLPQLILPSMEFSGALSRVLFSPLVAVDEIATYFFGGCAGHQWFLSKDVCLCEEANVKPLLQKALVGPVFGCTEQQYALRLQCVQAAMTHGLWGEDKYYMGVCDERGHMNNPVACLSAGEWAYQEWPKDLDSVAAPMWAQCEHCFDLKDGKTWINPSFQPPDPNGKDNPCVQKYGKFFRLGPDGNCYDYRAPVGMQGPGQYAWPDEEGHDPLGGSNESCTIL